METIIIKFGGGVGLRVSITDAMIQDYQDCQRCASQSGPGKDCDSCSLNIDVLAYALCEIPKVTEKIQELEDGQNSYRLLRKEMQEDGICDADIEMAIGMIKQLRQEN